MSNTPQLSLPLLVSAQAQKHVTVNEALIRLDAMAQPVALSADINTPPGAIDGDTYIVGSTPTDAWSGRATEIAVYDNGGWLFLTAKVGWRIWVADRGAYATYHGGRWIHAMCGQVANGAHTSIQTSFVDQVVTGAIVTSGLIIPDRAVVFGVTARVISSITGPGLTGWRVGVAGFDDRYGKEIGLTQNSSSNGVSGSPVAYFADTPLLFTAEGGVFDGGQIRLAAHYISLTPPDLA